MAGKTLDVQKLTDPDRLGCEIASMWQTFNSNRQVQLDRWKELRNYLYATDTTTTENSTLPWKNKTTTPKLTQIRDNLFANYMATMYPKRRWLKWEGTNEDSQTPEKRKAIESYIYYCVQQPYFKQEIAKLVYDFIDYGNVFAGVAWRDEQHEVNDQVKLGFSGPVPVRYNPMDVVINPVASSFTDSPKIFRSLVTIGELKEMLQWPTANTEEGQVAKPMFEYFKNIRELAANVPQGDNTEKNNAYSMDGFTSFIEYLKSPYIEVLTFYGDIYDYDQDTFLKNHKVVVVDRHKVIWKGPNQSKFGRAQVFHAGWRIRQDNLWAMGPLENLVGLQYRIDHLENLKADCFDLIAFPPLKVKGHIQDFVWGPMERLHVGEDGDVEIMSPNVEALKANLEIENLMAKMEEMAGAPKEAMGFRTPGEKTKYEVQSLENAASRIFQNKIAHFEEQVIEPILNAMLELAIRYGVDISVPTVDDEFGATINVDITTEDIIGQGAIRPVAARHFAESAQLVQNLTNFYGSAIAKDVGVMRNFSGIRTARMVEEILEIEDWELVEENVRIAEDQEAARLQQAAQEETFVQGQTPAGIAPNDMQPIEGAPPVGPNPNLQ